MAGTEVGFVPAHALTLARAWTLEDVKRRLARELYVARQQARNGSDYWTGYADALGDVLSMIQDCMGGGFFMITRGVEAVRVLEALESGPKMLSDVIEDTGLPYKDVLSTLRILERKGLVERARGGFYYLRKGAGA